jgi:hypothetical protein
MSDNLLEAEEIDRKLCEVALKASCQLIASEKRTKEHTKNLISSSIKPLWILTGLNVISIFALTIHNLAK